MAQNTSLDVFWALYRIPSLLLLIHQPLPAHSVGYVVPWWWYCKWWWQVVFVRRCNLASRSDYVVPKKCI